MNRIPVAGPSITEKEIAYVNDAIRNAWYSNANMYNERFENSFANYIGVKHAVSLPSCTSAIHLALLALGIADGDEVIVPESTWIASAAPISYVGATPVFVDVDARDWCISQSSLEQHITSRTKAVILVELYGSMPNIQKIQEIAAKHNLPIIEDSAEAIGSEWQCRKAGSFGDVGVFSFHGSKTLTTGEGGMLVTDRDDIFSQILVFRDHGRRPGDTMFMNSEVGYKYKMSSLQAALGLAQLERIDELITKKRQIFSWYQEELSDVEGITLNFETPTSKNSYWMNTVILAPELGITKEMLIHQLRSENIDCRPFFYPLSSLIAYREHPQFTSGSIENPTAYKLSTYGVNLPSALSLDKEQVAFVCHRLKEFIGKRA